METIYLYLLPTTVALAWIVAFVAAGRFRQLQDRILLTFLATGGATLFISQRIILYGACDYLYIIFYSLALLLELSVCPLLFLYMRSVTKDASWHSRYLWLFTPALLFGMGYFVLSIAVGWDTILKAKDYSSSLFTASPDSTAEWLLQLVGFDVFYLIIEVMSVILLALSVHDLLQYYRHSGDYFANLDDSSSDKMRNVLVSAILLLLSMFLLSCLPLDIDGNNIGLLVFRSLWFAAMMWMIASNAYKIVMTEECLDVLGLDTEETTLPESEEKKTETPSSSAADTEIARKLAEWQQQAGKPYCKEGITVVEMAKEIEVSPRAISAYIHETMDINFNRWINTLRIEEAKRLLSSHPEYKINYISSLCGYPTQSAFTRAFRQIEGKNPQNYRDSVVE